MRFDKNSLLKLRKKSKRNELLKIIFVISIFFLIFFSVLFLTKVIDKPHQIYIKKKNIQSSDISNVQSVDFQDNTLVDLDHASDEYDSYNVETNIQSESNEYDGAYSFNKNDVNSIENGHFYGSPNNSIEQGDYTSNPSEIEWIDDYSLNDGKVSISNWNNHKNVLNLTSALNQDSILYHDIESSTEGIIELYIGSNNVDGANGYMRLRQSAQSVIYWKIDSHKLYERVEGGFDVIKDPILVNTWYHIKIAWRDDNTYDIYCNNEKIVDNHNTLIELTTGIDEIQFWSYGQPYLYNIYFDGFGYSIDTSYNINDNLYQDISISNESFYENNITATQDTFIQIDESYNDHDYVLHLNDTNDYYYSGYGNSSEIVYPSTDDFEFMSGNFSDTSGTIIDTDNDCLEIEGLYKNGTYIAEYSFINDTIGSVPKGWETTGNAAVISEMDNHSKVLSNNYLLMNTVFSDMADGQVEFWFRTDNVETLTTIQLRDDNSAEIILLIFEGDVGYYDGSYHYILTIDSNTWYHSYIDFDTTTELFDWTIKDNETQLYSDTALSFDGSTIDGIDELSFATVAPTTLYVDGVDFSWSNGYYGNRNYNAVDLFLIELEIEFLIENIDFINSLSLNYSIGTNGSGFLAVYNNDLLKYDIVNQSFSENIFENEFVFNSSHLDDDDNIKFYILSLLYDYENYLNIDKSVIHLNTKNDGYILISSDFDDMNVLESTFYLFATNSCSIQFYDLSDNIIFKIKFTENSTNVMYPNGLIYYYESILNKWTNLCFIINLKTKSFDLLFNYITIADDISYYYNDITYFKTSYFSFRTIGVGNYYLDSFDDSTQLDYEYQRNFIPISERVEYYQVDNLEFDYNELEFEYNLTRFEQKENSTTENNVFVENVNGLGSSLYIMSNSSNSGSNGVIWNVHNDDNACNIKMKFKIFNMTNQDDYIIFSLTNFGNYGIDNNGSLDFKFQLDDDELFLWIDLDFSNETNFEKLKQLEMNVYIDLSLYISFVNYFYKFVINDYTIKPFIYNFDSNENNVDFDEKFGQITQLSFYYNYFEHSINDYSYFKLDSIAFKNKDGGNAYSTTLSEYASFSYQIPDLNTNEHNLISTDTSTPSTTELINDYLSNIPFYDDISDEIERLLELTSTFGTVSGMARFLIGQTNRIADEANEWLLSIIERDDLDDNDYTTNSIPYTECINQISIDNSFLEGSGLSLHHNTINLYRPSSSLSSSSLRSSGVYEDSTIFLKMYNWFTEPPSLKIHGVSVISEGQKIIPSYSYSASSKGNYFEVIDDVLSWKYSKTSKNLNNESVDISFYIDDLHINNESIIQFISLLKNNYSGSITLYDVNELESTTYYFNSTISETKENININSSYSSLKTSGNALSKITIKLQALASNITSYFSNQIKNFAAGFISALDFFTNKTILDIEYIEIASFQDGLILSLVYLTLFLLPSFVVYKIIGFNSFTILWLFFLFIFFLIGQFPFWLIIFQSYGLIGMFLIERNNERDGDDI